MSIQIDKYEFEGPFSKIDDLRDLSGLYAVYCRKNSDLFLLDIGESTIVRSQIYYHDRQKCWSKFCDSRSIIFFVHYTPQMTEEERQKIVSEIRYKYNPPCGMK